MRPLFDPDQDEVVTEKEWLNKWMNINNYVQFVPNLSIYH